MTTNALKGALLITTHPDSETPRMSMLARTAAALGHIFLNTLVFPNGRRVRTTLASVEAVESYERWRDFDLSYDWDRYEDEPSRRPHEIIEEMPPVPGSVWELVLKHNMDMDNDSWLYHEWEAHFEKKEAERRQADSDALEIEMYARLERPRNRRMRPAPEWHIKRLGHRAAQEEANWSDRLDRKLGLGNYKRYPKPADAA
jgi:hypothetical protein